MKYYNSFLHSWLTIATNVFFDGIRAVHCEAVSALVLWMATGRVKQPDHTEPTRIAELRQFLGKGHKAQLDFSLPPKVVVETVISRRSSSVGAIDSKSKRKTDTPSAPNDDADWEISLEGLSKESFCQHSSHISRWDKTSWPSWNEYLNKCICVSVGRVGNSTGLGRGVLIEWKNSLGIIQCCSHSSG